MRSIQLKLIAVAVAAIAIMGLAAMPAAQASEPVNVEGALFGGTAHTCFWYYGAGSESVNERGEKFDNISYPDGDAYYLAAYYRRPVGSTLKLHGEYPYARYTSVISYNAAGQIVDDLNDEMIAPDPGSVDPFLEGVSRSAPNRKYTLTLSHTTLAGTNLSHFAGEPVRNTLYTAAPTNVETLTNPETHVTRKFETEVLMIRIYVPNKGLGPTGGVPLPEPELTLSAAEGGGTYTGQEACNKLDAESNTRRAEQAENKEPVSYRLPEANSLNLSKAIWHALSKPWELSAACNVNAQAQTCPLPKNPLATTELVQEPREVENRAAFPAKETEEWRGQFSRKYLLQAWTGENAPGSEPAGAGCQGNGPGCEPVKAGGGGFFPNNDNSHERDILSRVFGKVVVMKGKMPTTPETFENPNGTWPALGSYQARYESLCMENSPRSGAVMACLYDEQVPTNANHEYTIAISRPEERPKNAVRFCGVGWIEWNKSGDGEEAPETNEEFGMMQIRMMLANRSFKQSAQYVVKAGTEREIMGPYLPTVHYDKEVASFEAEKGCSWANPGVPQLAGGSSTPNTGGFSLEWTPSREAAKVSGVTYTLQQKSRNGGWETVASGLTSPAYTFSSAPQGTFVYRVSASGEGAESENSGESSAVKVDRSAPPAPSALVSRAPDYAGGGGWYKGSVMVSFASNGTATLPDGSEGAALEPSSLTGVQTVETSGSHEVCGTVADVLGDVSSPGCVTVQVDATAPSLEVSCPATAELDASGVNATVSASDGQSGLAKDPSGSVAISTESLGDQTTSETAIDNVGNETTKSCTTDVVYAFSKLKPASGKKVKAGKAAAVSFHLGDALGYVTDGSGTLEIAAEGGSFKPATSATNSGDKFANMKNGLYTYSLSTTGLAKGSYTLRVNVSDGTTHTTSITIK